MTGHNPRHRIHDLAIFLWMKVGHKGTAATRLRRPGVAWDKKDISSARRRPVSSGLSDSWVGTGAAPLHRRVPGLRRRASGLSLISAHPAVGLPGKPGRPPGPPPPRSGRRRPPPAAAPCPSPEPRGRRARGRRSLPASSAPMARWLSAMNNPWNARQTT